MENRGKHIVTALGGNALDNTLPEQMRAVKIIVKIIVGLIGEGCKIIVAYGNGLQAGVINNTMAALSREDANQPNTPLSVYVAMSQAYIGYDLQDALREGLYNRGMYDIPVVTMIIRIRVDADDPAFKAPSKPIGHFIAEEQVRIAEGRYGYIMKEDSGRGSRCVVAPPKPVEIAKIDTIRSLIDSGQLVITCGDGGIPVTRQGNHLRDASAVIDKDFASELLAEDLNADPLIIFTTVEKVAINFGKPEEKWLNDLGTEKVRQYTKEGHFAPGSMLPKVRIAVRFAESKPGYTTLIMLLEKAKGGIQGKTDTHTHLA